MKLVDTYTESEAQIWVQLHGHDLDWNEIGDVSALAGGEPTENEPEWLRYELQENGLDMISGIDGSTFRPEARLGWLLGEGLVPEQPFQVSIGSPRYHTDYWGETDWDIDFDIVARAPWTPERCAESLEKYLKRSQRYGMEDSRAALLNQIRARTSLKNLYLRCSNYSTGENWAGPKVGTTVEVMAKNGEHHHHELIARGRSDTADFEDCLKQVLLRTRLEFPELTAAALRSLPRRWL